MDDRDLDINDVTDTESSASESSSSIEEGIFKTHIPFVLELHDIRKDDPLIPGLQPVGSAAVGPTVAKIKKHKKKKKVPGGKDTSHTSLSDSPSDTSSVAPSVTEVKEEFYDAHESYHAMPENQIPVALAARLVGRTEADQNPKGPELSTSSEPQTTTPVTHSEPSPIIGVCLRLLRVVPVSHKQGAGRPVSPLHRLPGGHSALFSIIDRQEPSIPDSASPLSVTEPRSPTFRDFPRLTIHQFEEYRCVFPTCEVKLQRISTRPFLAAMEKPARYKAKSKKPAAKPKTSKKRKSDGPTCSMFLAELTRKLAYKRKQQAAEEPRNIIQTIIDSITNALPIKVSKKNSPQKYPSPIKMETLQSFAPELMPSDTLHYTPVTSNCVEDGMCIQGVEIATEKPGSFKMPKMPLVNSEVIKLAVLKKKKITMQDQGVNTGAELDVAAEISKHVSTLRKISLIAEEFNQKTAKNLKEIVDSVQEDLIKKLAEIQAEQSSERAFQIPEESNHEDD